MARGWLEQTAGYRAKSDRVPRWILWTAALVSVTIVPFAWVRAVGNGTIIGNPGLHTICALIVLLIAALLGGCWLRQRVPFSTRTAHGRSMVLLMVLVWSAVVAVSVFWRWQIWGPAWLAASLAVLASLHLLWSLWMNYLPIAWPIRGGVLGLLLLSALPLLVLFRFEGIAGQGEPILNWRGSQPLAVAPRELTLDRQPSTKYAADYPQFLGPARNGSIDDLRLVSWNVAPPSIVWRRSVGAGWSSFAVASDVAYTQEQQDQQEWVVAYRLLDGKQLWRHSDNLHFTSVASGEGPRATPTIVEGRVYSVGATGRLNCLDAVTGEPIWRADIGGDGELLPHGTAGSPLVVPPWVVVCPAHEGNSGVAAYDIETGELRWQNLSHPSSYSSPVYARIGGVEQVIVHQQDALRGFELQTGTELWQFPWSNSEKTIASQPIVPAGAANRVLASCGYGSGAALLNVGHTAEGWVAQQVWTSRHLKTKFCTAVLVEDTLFALDDGILVAVDLSNGQLRWKQGRYGHGQLMRAGDTLIVVSERGEVIQVAVDGTQHRELGRASVLSSKTWNHPALAWPYLLVRNDREAVCLRLQPASDPPNPY